MRRRPTEKRLPAVTANGLPFRARPRHHWLAEERAVEGAGMKAYVIVQETVKDEEMFAAYHNSVVATLQEFNGRFVVRGGQLTVVEGELAASPIGGDRVPLEGGGRRMVPFPRLAHRLPAAPVKPRSAVGGRPKRKCPIIATADYRPTAWECSIGAAGEDSVLGSFVWMTEGCLLFRFWRQA